MKYLLLFLFLWPSLVLHAQRNRKTGTITVKGKVTTTADYCGGAAPSEDMLEELRKPKPAAKKLILVKYGCVNDEKIRVVKRIITDEKGEFQVVLKKGFDYQFVEEWKAMPFKVPDNTEWTTWDAACLKKRYQTPDFVLRKKQRNQVVSINYHQPCFYRPYCGTYSGPLPP